MHDDPRVREQRSVILSVMLTALFGGGAMFVSFLLCGGLSINMLAVVGGVVALGYFHYLLWGRSMSHEVHGDLKGMEREGTMEDPTWNWDEPSRHGKL